MKRRLKRLSPSEWNSRGYEPGGLANQPFSVGVRSTRGGESRGPCILAGMVMAFI
jgi:hypothetical protein